MVKYGDLGGGGGEGGRGWVTSHIWHSTDVRVECPPFSALPDWPPFFDKKCVTDPISLNWYMKGPSFFCFFFFFF